MSRSAGDQERYAEIVRGHLDGQYTMDPDDAEHVALDVIAAYQQDQAARQEAGPTDAEVKARIRAAVAEAMRDQAIERQAAMGRVVEAARYAVTTTTEDDLPGDVRQELSDALAALDATEQEARDGNKPPGPPDPPEVPFRPKEYA